MRIFYHAKKTAEAAEELHVFIEVYATNPAFLQMFQYIRLSKESRKIIAWHRFPERANLIDLKKNNTKEISSPHTEFKKEELVQEVLNETIKEMENDPKLKLVLYANMDKLEVVLRPFLENIPQERIKHIHLFEDGLGVLFKYKDSPNAFGHCSAQEFVEALKQKQFLDGHMAFGLAYYYPLTMHLFGWDIIQDLPDYAEIRKNLKHIDVRNVDFDDLRETLSSKEKKLIYRLVDFDNDYWSKILKDKKSVIYTSGWLPPDRAKAEQNILKKLMSDEQFSGLKNSEYIWIYKPHPSWAAYNAIDALKRTFPQLMEMPAKIPFEILIIADLLPTKVAGFASSLFYTIDEGRILYYVTNTYREDVGNYADFLKRFKKMDERKILQLYDFM